MIKSKLLPRIFKMSASYASTNPQGAKNVLGQSLQLFSKQPLTGFHRDGYCRVSAADMGNHSVAGKLPFHLL
jgi:uncharacterized protein (DUF2237 family)